MTNYHVRLLEKEGDVYEDTRQDYSIEELGGIVPSVGDFIVDSGVSASLDRREPENRRVYEVVARYFTPGDWMAKKGEDVKFAYVNLIVESRPGRKEEMATLGA